MARALVIDDSRAIRMILAGILRELHFEVDALGNGREALEFLEKKKPDVRLMLVDWNMPEVDGLEFVKRVRTMPDYASASLMMVTTETEMEQMTAALEAGVNEYVMKPFTTEMIAGKLRLMGLVE